MARDFFVVLGVAPDADLDRIRSAYRDLVRLYQPRLEAVRRPQPDEAAAEDESAATEEGIQQIQLDLSRKPVAARRGAPPRPPGARDEDRYTELDEQLAGWVPGLFHSERQSPRHKDLFVELVLRPAEASAGGLMPLEIPVEVRCPDCDGAAPAERLSCASCDNRGWLVEHRALEIAVPPGVADGTRVKLSLRDVGLPATELHVLVTVER
jgi:hypothetical protein